MDGTKSSHQENIGGKMMSEIELVMAEDGDCGYLRSRHLKCGVWEIRVGT